MTNVTQLETPEPDRRARAAFVKQQIENEERSVRYMAAKIGINHTVLGLRLRGEIAFGADEIESIAHVLRQDPVDFFRNYLAAGQSKAVKLPDQDSNLEPAGFKPHRFMALDEFLTDAASDAPETGHLATVTPIREAPTVGQKTRSHGR